MKRFSWLGLLLCLIAVWAGCGDTFRPIIIPNPPAFPDPRSNHTVIAVNNNNGDANQGTVMQIDVSGDTNIDVSPVGFAPVHAMQQTATQVLVVNHATGQNLANSLMKLSFATGIITPTTISLPQESAPNFVAIAPNDTTAYVSMPGSSPPQVAVINTTQNSIEATINVGHNPVALAVTPDRKRLYVANQGDSTISGFNTIDRTLRNNPIKLDQPPIWVLSRSDSQRVYVLEQDGTVATLDTTSTSGPDTVIDTTTTGSGVTYMLYDGQLNRLYVPAVDAQSNPELVVLDVSQSTRLLATVPLSASGSPASAVAVAALPDTTRVYAASNGPAQTTAVNTISSVSGDGNTATYTFDPNSITGPSPQLGMSLTISEVSGGNDGFDGTFIVIGVSANTFLVANTTSGTSNAGRTASGTNFFPVVTVINKSSNQVKTTVNMPAVPAAGPFEPPVCSDPGTRFRFTMAAGGDSSRVYLASCDGGNVNFIQTFDDTYLLSLPSPGSARAPIPPNSQPPPQNPVFLIAGP